jgi:hypothetical protein
MLQIGADFTKLVTAVIYIKAATKKWDVTILDRFY